MMYLLLVCQLALSAILLLAATGKILQSKQFRSALLLSNLPKAFITSVALLTPTLELCLAVGMILSPSQLLPIVMAATMGLLAVFTLWIISVYTHGLQLRCGCFGAGGAKIGPRTILRNVLLIFLAGGGLLLSLRSSSPLPPPSLWMVIVVLSSGMCFMLFQAFRQVRPTLILSMAQLDRTQREAELPQGDSLADSAS